MKVSFQFTCADGTRACDKVKELTPFSKGAILVENQRFYDDFDHRFIIEVKDIFEIRQIESEIRRKAANDLIDLQIVEV